MFLCAIISYKTDYFVNKKVLISWIQRATVQRINLGNLSVTKNTIFILLSNIEQHLCNVFVHIYLYGFFCISAATQRPTHGSVLSPVATHLGTDIVGRGMRRSRIRILDHCFAVRCVTTSHLSSCVYSCRGLHIVGDICSGMWHHTV